MGEGEGTIVELARAVAAHRSLSGITGIAYMDWPKDMVNKRRLLNKLPAYDLFPIEFYRLSREWPIEGLRRFL